MSRDRQNINFETLPVTSLQSCEMASEVSLASNYKVIYSAYLLNHWENIENILDDIILLLKTSEVQSTIHTL